MRSLTSLVLCLSLLPASLSWAQNTPPDTEIFLASMQLSTKNIKIGTPSNISNSPGYDSQPFFMPDNQSILYTSGRDAKQTDIYRYQLASKATTQITHTAETEYSALLAPDGLSILCVHGSEQSIFRYDLDGQNPRLAYQHGTQLIGYHLWLTSKQVATFILGGDDKGNTLQVIDTTSGKAEMIASGANDIGRSILKRPHKNTVSFVAKETPEHWILKEFDITTHEVTRLVETPKGSEDLTWLIDGTALMGQGSKIYAWKNAQAWKEVADFSAQGVVNITRLSASPDGKWLAIVGELQK
jgi:hypothetical protein